MEKESKEQPTRKGCGIKNFLYRYDLIRHFLKLYTIAWLIGKVARHFRKFYFKIICVHSVNMT